MEMEYKNTKAAEKAKESKTVYPGNDNDKRAEDAYSMGFQSRDPIISIPVQEKFEKKMASHGGHNLGVKHPTTYLETLMHLFKGNVGSGMFAMGDAFKNAGLGMAPWLVVFLGIICVHSQHLLLTCSKNLKAQLNLESYPDFAGTVELCFATGPERLQKFAPHMRRIVNVFLCITQFGFCCVYFVFISSNVKQIMDYYHVEWDVHYHMAIALVPILASCLIRNLKYLAPCSTVANVSMLGGIAITLYYACRDLPPVSSVTTVAKVQQFPLFFGTALFAFEGIGLVLPLQSEMKQPDQFRKTFGVLNVGMTVVTFLYVLVGFLSYLKYGDAIEGSVTLNLPKDEILAQVVKAMISFGILLTFALQFYIPIDIMFPTVTEKFGPFKRPVCAELIFRVIFVFVTFVLAEAIPYLNLFITLVGAFSSTTIALLIPPLLELVSNWGDSKVTAWMVIKNSFILIVGILGCVTGSYESIRLIIKAFINGDES